jgi:hypothetical protein
MHTLLPSNSALSLKIKLLSSQHCTPASENIANPVVTLNQWVHEGETFIILNAKLDEDV